jgi:hypothetical protein
MPNRASATHDGHRHVPVEHRPGYFECDLCGRRWIHRLVLPDGTPTPEDIDWLHHSKRPRR